MVLGYNLTSKQKHLEPRKVYSLCLGCLFVVREKIAIYTYCIGALRVKLKIRN